MEKKLDWKTFNPRIEKQLSRIENALNKIDNILPDEHKSNFTDEVQILIEEFRKAN